MNRTPTMSDFSFQPNQQLTKSQYILSKNIPSQQISNKSEQDQPVRALVLQEKTNININARRFNNKYKYISNDIQSLFGRVKEIDLIMDRAKQQPIPLIVSQEPTKRTKLRELSPSPSQPSQNIRSQVRLGSDHVRLIEQYEARLTQVNLESQGLQNQIFTEQQRYNQMLTDQELQVKSQAITIESERKTSEQFKLLMQSKNEELRISNKQIDNLEKKVQDSSNKIIILTQEIDRMKSIVVDRNFEIDRLKVQFEDREKAHQQDTDRYKIDMGYLQELEMKIKDITIQQTEEASRIDEQIKHHRYKQQEFEDESMIQDQEIQSFHRRIHEAQIEKEQLISQNQLSLREIDANKDTISERDREIEAFKLRHSQQERSHQNSLDEMRQHYEYIKKQTLDRELQEISTKHLSEKATMESQSRMLIQRVNDIEAILGELRNENKKYSESIADCKDECQGWMNKNASNEQEKLRLIALLESTNKDHDNLNQMTEITLTQQLNQSEKQLQGMMDNLIQRQDTIHTLEYDNLRMSKLIQDYQIENDILRQRTIELDNKFKDLVIEVEQYKRNQMQQQELYDTKIIQLQDQLQDENNHYVMELEQTKQLLTKSHIENDKLVLKYDNLEKVRQSELLDYTQEFDANKQQLKDQLGRVNSDKIQLENNNKQLKMKIIEQDTQLIQYQFQFDQDKQDKQELLKQKEIQLNKLMSEKLTLEQTLKTVKEKFNDCQIERQTLTDQLHGCELEIKELQIFSDGDRVQNVQQRMLLEQQNRAFKQTTNQLDLQLQSSKQSLDVAEKSIEVTKIEIQTSRDNYNNMQMKSLLEITKLKKEIQTFQTQGNEKSQQKDQLAQDEIVVLRKKIKSLENELDDQQKRFEALDIELTKEIENLENQNEYLQKLQSDYKEQDQKYQTTRIQLDTQVVQLKRKYEDEQTKSDRAAEQVRKLEDLLDEKLQEIDQLRHNLSVSKVSDEEYNLQQKKTAQIQDELFVLQQDKLRLNSEKVNQDKAIQRLQNEIQVKSQEVQQVYDLMNKRRQESDIIGREMDNSKRENQKQLIQLQELDANLKAKQDLISDLTRQNDDITIGNQQLKRQLTAMEEHYSKRESDTTRSSKFKKN